MSSIKKPIAVTPGPSMKNSNALSDYVGSRSNRPNKFNEKSALDLLKNTRLDGVKTELMRDVFVGSAADNKIDENKLFKEIAQSKSVDPGKARLVRAILTRGGQNDFSEDKNLQKLLAAPSVSPEQEKVLARILALARDGNDIDEDKAWDRVLKTNVTPLGAQRAIEALEEARKGNDLDDQQRFYDALDTRTKGPVVEQPIAKTREASFDNSYALSDFIMARANHPNKFNEKKAADLLKNTKIDARQTDLLRSIFSASAEGNRIDENKLFQQVVTGKSLSDSKVRVVKAVLATGGKKDFDETKNLTRLMDAPTVSPNQEAVLIRILELARDGNDFDEDKGWHRTLQTPNLTTTGAQRAIEALEESAHGNDLNDQQRFYDALDTRI